MQKKLLSALITLCLVLGMLSGTASAADGQQVVYARTSEELMQAIRSNTKIILDEKDYLFDRSVAIQNIENLTIEGGALTRILTSSSMIAVIEIGNSNGILLSGFTAGHEQRGNCDQGVLSIANSSVTVDGCDLFGCGTDGITFINSKVTVNKTTIRDCSRNIVNSVSSQGVFENCTFSGNGYVPSMESAIGIKSNETDSGKNTLSFTNCVFINNKNESLVDKSADVTFTNCTFTGNSWIDETTAVGDSGTCGSNLTWSLQDGSMVVTGTGNMEYIGSENESNKWGGHSQNIKTLTIANEITSISGQAFFHCTNLESVSIGEGVTSIEYSAFNSCFKLCSVYIPKSVKSIGYGAFAGCSELKDIYYSGSEAEWNNITIQKAEYNDALNTATIHYNSPSPATTSAFTPTEPTTIGGFSDVKANAYYAEPVLWAVGKQITNGTSTTTFSPDETCTNAQILSFLWRASGSPEPTSENPFNDVKTSDYFYKAALWAFEKGLISGTSLDGGKQCTRSMTVGYLWKMAGSPASEKSLAFVDIPANAEYTQAVIWAVEKGITNGTGTTTFSPDDTCTRAQIVTFLYRDLA